MGNEDNQDSCSTPAHCLRLPGRKLNLTALLYAKRFRNHGYKKGALAAFRELEEAGLGVLEDKKTKSGIVRIHFCVDMWPNYLFVIYSNTSFTRLKYPPHLKKRQSWPKNYNPTMCRLWSTQRLFSKRR